MKTHHAAGIISAATMLIFVYLALSATVFDGKNIGAGFLTGFICGGSWIVLVLYDPKNKHQIKKETDKT